MIHDIFVFFQLGRIKDPNYAGSQWDACGEIPVSEQTNVKPGEICDGFFGACGRVRDFYCFAATLHLFSTQAVGFFFNGLLYSITKNILFKV